MVTDKVKTVPGSKMYVGKVTESNIEGKKAEEETIRKNSRAQGKKSAGQVGATNMNVA